MDTLTFYSPWGFDKPKNCSEDVRDDSDHDDDEDTEDEEGGQADLEFLPSEEYGHDEASEDKDTQLEEVRKAFIELLNYFIC